ncbi:MAG: DMT family transporter [Deltaproteobacteria bacterium]|nr:DMT family transporter [Deltaproteobacteria bacterium]
MAGQEKAVESLLTRLYRSPYLLLTAAVFFWAVNSVLGRYMRLDIPPVALAFWRWAGAALLIAGFAWPHMKRDWPVMRDRRHLPLLLLLALTGVAMFNTLLYSGLHSTTAINAFLIQSLMPVLIILFSFLLFRDRVTGRQALGVVLSLAGAVLVIARGDAGVLRSLGLNRGDLLILVAVIGYALYSTLLRRRPQIHPLSFIGFTFIGGTLMLVPLYLWETLAVKRLVLTLPALLTIVYVAVFPSVVSYFCYNRGVELIGANRAGLFMHLIPVFGTGMALVFLGERFFWFHGLGALMIIGGIFLTLSRPRRAGRRPG